MEHTNEEQKVEATPEGELESAAGKLSRDAALEVAAEALKQKDEVVASGSKSVDAAPQQEAPVALEPPNWMTKEEKEDFRLLSRIGQEAQLRLHKSREAHRIELDRKAAELAKEKEDSKWVRDIKERLTTFYQSRDGKAPSEQDIVAALEFSNQFGKDAKKAALAILQESGVELPADLAAAAEKKREDSKPPVQNIEEVVSSKVDEKLSLIRKEQFIRESWGRFVETKNAAGQPKYPGLVQGDEESITRLASQVGSLVNEQTPLGQQFIQRTRERIPDASYERLLEEAYRFVGGQIADSDVPKSQDPQKHLIKSNRAASSIPGGGLNGITSGSSVKKLSREEALKRAAKELYGG